ncbi:TetR/AcrR family transcriptional regulator [Absicoccus porci]|uniref:TetR/AcrR family transcriptional regulator n=1 Tax=Absicoccus porci TaxID=2486576 RepID=UPI00156979DC|nr:helix-turn-helix domain-containing protein [Absicoccus porci]MEE1354917.1 TetR/AcrR family transcriptional regulator [Absicoccus porci]
MPSSPKIKKEDMLQAALKIVAKNGYAALNIKAVAKELGCSTAPISWQFGGMDGLREELIPFVEKYVENTYYSQSKNEFATFEQRGKGTIDLALENPNLFHFLYTGQRSQLLSTGFEFQTNDQNTFNMFQKMAEMLGITPKQVMDFAMTMMVYTQGIGTLIASGIVKDTKENMYRMLHNTGMTYLKGLGVKESTLLDLSGGDKSDENSSNG